MEWEYSEDYGLWVCPNCDFGLETFDDPDCSPGDFDYHFCPYCGEKLSYEMFVIIKPAEVE